jgi:hypothetical protein
MSHGAKCVASSMRIQTWCIACATTPDGLVTGGGKMDARVLM